MKLKAATALLPQLQDLGITAVSLNPITTGEPAPDIRYEVFYGPTKPDQIDPQIGSEWDVAIGYEPNPFLELRLTGGAFEPGKAFEGHDSRARLVAFQSKFRF